MLQQTVFCRPPIHQPADDVVERMANFLAERHASGGAVTESDLFAEFSPEELERHLHKARERARALRETRPVRFQPEDAKPVAAAKHPPSQKFETRRSPKGVKRAARSRR